MASLGEINQTVITLDNNTHHVLTEAGRFRLLPYPQTGKQILLWDDSYRIKALFLETARDCKNQEKENNPCSENGCFFCRAWIHWADYKQCNLPGVGGAIADHLMGFSKECEL